jgi:hypothetical protein
MRWKTCKTYKRTPGFGENFTFLGACGAGRLPVRTGLVGSFRGDSTRCAIGVRVALTWSASSNSTRLAPVFSRYLGVVKSASGFFPADLWSFTLAHSHLLVQHLLKQLEHHKRDRRERDRRPQWLSAFVHQTAALFEPLTGVARVGCQCELTPDGWEARLFLGSTEIVGGRDDGRSRLISYEFDFGRLSQGFTRLDEFRWNVCTCDDGSTGSFVTLRGLVDDHMVCLKIYSRPPRDSRPAFRQFADGTLEDLVAT